MCLFSISVLSIPVRPNSAQINGNALFFPTERDFFFRGIRELYFSMPFSFQCQINGIEKKNAGSSSNHCFVPSPSLVFAPYLVRDSKLFEL